MKICMMTSVHHHDDVRIYHKEALSLADAGYDVTVLAPDYEGMAEGIHFVQCKPVVNRLGRVLTSWERYYRAALASGADVFHFHDPELLPAGALLKRKGKKVLFDVHEEIPLQLSSKPYLGERGASAAAGIYSSVEKHFITGLDGIIAATEEIGTRYPKAAVVHNYPWKKEFFPQEQPVYTLPYDLREHSICYVGLISETRGIRELIRALGPAGATLLLAGSFESPELERSLSNMEAFHRVRYWGHCGRKEIRTILSRCRAGIVTLHPTPNYLRSQPIKLFEYMMAGLPIIASHFPGWRDKLIPEDCALFVDPTSSREIADAILFLFRNPATARRMGEAGRQYAAAHYCWEEEQKKLIHVYESLEKDKGGAGLAYPAD